MRLVVLLSSLSLLWCQEEPVNFGLLLRGHSGVGYGAFGKVENDLKAANALGKDFRIVPWATTAGANLDILIAKRILLAGTLQLQHYDASETERGLARPRALHYGGQLGFAAVNKNLWLFYPYVGYQVGTNELRYTNYFTEPIYFGRNQELRPLDKRTYSSNLGLVEVGFGLRRWRRGVGVTLLWGADVGGVFAPSDGKWTASAGPEPEGVAPARLSGAYLRFSLGFGFVKPKSEGAAAPIPPAPAEKAKPEPSPKEKEKSAPPEKEEKPRKEKKRKKQEAAAEPTKAPATTQPSEPPKDKKGKKKKDEEDEED
ncbi:MAG: hypothetical protein RMJ57_08820 [Bacteroidia bacterium]|nr:hypothetical protein [Bacteroidia bacterium]